MKTRDDKKWKAPMSIFIIFLVFILVLFLQYLYLSLSPSVYGINMQEFASNRNTYSSTLYAKRGTIYDKDGNTLAIDVSSYTVIAYLDPSRTGSSTTLYHVADVEMTAKALAPILNMSVEDLVTLMSSNAYQVELGPGGRDITEITKTQIDELNLPGIDFVESYKRYYPNGDFASYVIGYAKRKDVQTEVNGIITTNNVISGELGIESEFEDILKGVNGYISYQKDRNGYKIPDTKEEKVDAVDGSNIYLTIDSNIQRIVKSAMTTALEKYNPEWLSMNVMDAKTGDILASASLPSYDPNTLNITNYENPLTSFVYEPGSVMKIYTYMCAMEKGTYNGNDTYQSGNINIEGTTIYDWYRAGWGEITFDKGFQLSSNVGVSYIVQRFINKDDLKSCLTKFGFGSTTGIQLPREMTGSIVFNYPVEVAAAAFGQGISITPVQMLRALSLISNNGKMLQPNIISKIVDSNGNVTYKREVSESDQIISQSTVDYLKQLMHNTVNESGATGTGYKVSGLDVIGKTGTAQIYSNGSYSTAENDKIYSFAGMFPKDNPKIVIFISMKKPKTGSSSALYNTTQPVIESIAKYLGLISSNANDDRVSSYTLESYINKKTDDVKSNLKDKGLNIIVLGDGDRIINQYPSSGSTVITNDKVILLTNGNITMPNLIGYSRIEAIATLNLLNVNYNFDGYGTVTYQNIKAGSAINDIISLKFEEKKKIE